MTTIAILNMSQACSPQMQPALSQPVHFVYLKVSSAHKEKLAISGMVQRRNGSRREVIVSHFPGLLKVLSSSALILGLIM